MKITYRELKPDDPIFQGRPQVSVLASRPIKANSKKSDAKTNQPDKRESKVCEQDQSEISRDEE